MNVLGPKRGIKVENGTDVANQMTLRERDAQRGPNVILRCGRGNVTGQRDGSKRRTWLNVADFTVIGRGHRLRNMHGSRSWKGKGCPRASRRNTAAVMP